MTTFRRRIFTRATGSQKAIIAIESLAVIEGRLSPRVLGLVTERAALHRQELRDAWRLAERHAPFKPIAPLEYAHAE